MQRCKQCLKEVICLLRGRLTELRYLLKDAEERKDDEALNRYRVMVRDTAAQIRCLQEIL